MDRRSWPWKKKSSEKIVTAADTNSASLASPVDNKINQDDTESVKYVQITVESYAYLTELEDQVKVLNDKVSNLKEKLSSAQSEMITKENLVKQHAKVAEEAISGWEKAEAEALALKQQLESVTLLKLSAEDRASHLDDALKECMKQVRNVKEESEQKLHDVVFAKAKQWEKARAELEVRIADFDQELLRSSADNAALSRTLQERSNMLMKISDEKFQADAEIELLKNDIRSCEQDINSLKYELHVSSKELEIRNEEKNMSMRSAEVANKQHVEDVKKITKLEAECQRLRGLVRKKLPGPAALAQMKLEVESLGRDYGEPKLRRSPAKSLSPHHASPSDFALENMQQSRKENEFLTARLLTMEEEMKMLKEALSKRNSELQASRNMCAKAANKLRSVEAHFLGTNQQKSPSKSIADIPVESVSNPPSLTSMSEDGIDEEGSCSESWATALMSELSHFKKGKIVDKGNKAESSSQLELMDDFLEMERLACLSSEANGNTTNSDGVADRLKEGPVNVQIDGDVSGENPDVEKLTTSISVDLDHPAAELASAKDESSLRKLQSRIVCLFDSQAKDADMGKLLEDIKCIAQDAHEELPYHSIGSAAGETCATGESHSDSSVQHECDENIEDAENEIIVKQDINRAMVGELKDAISRIHDFVVSFGKEAIENQSRSSDETGLTERIEEFSASLVKVLSNEATLDDFLIRLSHILSEASFLGYVSTDKGHEGEYSTDCVDKVTLLEKKVAQHEHSEEKLSGGCMHSSHSSAPEFEGPTSIGFELPNASFNCSSEEFERLKLEKKIVENDLAKCKEMVELTNHQLVEMEQHLSELKSQLAASEKSNSLAETQLKCMAESYKSLESQKQELESELNLLRSKAELLDKELQEEKHSHQGDLAKYKELQEQIERNSKCTVCPNSDVEVDDKMKQEKDIAAAAEKLAECQETILLLGKQLNAMRPAAEWTGASPNNTHQPSDAVLEAEPSASASVNFSNMLSIQHFDQAETENFSASTPQRTGGESPLNGYNPPKSPSETESGLFPRSPLNSKHKQRSSSRSSSSFSSIALPEKHGRGFSRFFSKGRSEH